MGRRWQLATSRCNAVEFKLPTALSIDGGPEMRTFRAATVHAGMQGTAKRRWVLLTGVVVATLTAVCGALIQSGPGASVTASIRPLKASVARAQTSPSGSVVTAAPAAPAHETVDLFGDSLGYQAEPYFDMFFAETGNFTVLNDTYGGTATCDWLSKMAAAAAAHPQAAVLVFSGNAFTA